MTDERSIPEYDLSSAPTDVELSTIRELGEDLFAAEVVVLKADAALKEAKVMRDDIAQNLIPQALDEAGLKAIETPTFRVMVKDVLRVQPKRDNRPLILQKVQELGGGNLIQSTVSVPFNVEEQEEATKLVALLAEQGLMVKEERSIHSSRLRAFVAARLKAGEEVDSDLFGVTEFREAKFTDGGPTPEVFEGEGS